MADSQSKIDVQFVKDGENDKLILSYTFTPGDPLDKDPTFAVTQTLGWKDASGDPKKAVSMRVIDASQVTKQGASYSFEFELDTDVTDLMVKTYKDELKSENDPTLHEDEDQVRLGKDLLNKKTATVLKVSPGGKLESHIAPVPHLTSDATGPVAPNTAITLKWTIDNFVSGMTAKVSSDSDPGDSKFSFGGQDVTLGADGSGTLAVNPTNAGDFNFKLTVTPPGGTGEGKDLLHAVDSDPLKVTVLAAPATFPDWLLESVRGQVINYDETAKNPLDKSAATNTTQLYCLKNLFGFRQDFTSANSSNVHAIFYLLLVEVQKALWTQFLATSPADKSQKSFQSFCGATQASGGRHGQGTYEQHCIGGAIDLEYSRSPYVPMRDSAGNVNYDSSSYAAAADKTPWPKGAVHDKIAGPICDLWNKIAGGKTSAVVSPGSAATEAAVDAIMKLNQQIISYFSGKGDADLELQLVQYGMPMGNVVYVAGGPPWDFSRGASGKRDPRKGICGVSKVVVMAMINAKTAVSPASNYSIKWAPFIFGGDLMHFDVEHPHGRTVRCDIGDVNAAAKAVEAYFTGSNDGKSPWGAK